MEFVKMHGLGNDFIIVQEGQADLPAEKYAEAARRFCAPHWGIGADGLVLVGPDPEFDLRMRIFNADGSEAEMCGNAIRCVAKYAWEAGLCRKQGLRIGTLGGPREATLLTAGGRVTGVRVEMGRPVLAAAAIPVRAPESPVVGGKLAVAEREFTFTAVSMGNPHCVIEVDEAATFPVRQWGPLIEAHPLFPAKTNVEFVTVVDAHRVIMRVWERGVGETLACGTGACATVVACALMGLTGRRVTVQLAGGDLLIEWSASDDHVYMTGGATLVFTGRVDLNWQPGTEGREL
ncbi:MAG: diaminopimelate epimerase [Firmicutes bacterium]|nr:diaminopimelate epimerase [Bacillota bacterium]